MIFTPTPIPGAWLIDIEPNRDERGFFARTVCADEFKHHGLSAKFTQQSLAWNPKRGTMRGLHYQAEPHGEDKLVRVTRGRIWDVIVDIRRDSPMFGKWFSVELSSESRRQLYIPRGIAHGYQTLDDETELFYQMSAAYHADLARGLRWDDPAIGIPWPACEWRVMSDRDRLLPALSEVFSDVE